MARKSKESNLPSDGPLSDTSTQQTPASDDEYLVEQDQDYDEIETHIEAEETPLTIAEQQARQLDVLEDLKKSQEAARAANAVTHFTGSTSPLKLDRAAQNQCPRCDNLALTVYQGLKICYPCGWRSDRLYSL